MLYQGGMCFDPSCFGVLTRAHLARLGMDTYRCRRAIEQGRLRRERPGVFVVGGMLKVPQVREWVRKQFRNAVLAGFDIGEQEDDCITAISQGLYRQIG